jgi:phage/plasmid-like protein (TIGR03299 family)
MMEGLNMAHRLSIREDGRAEMAYAGVAPWHGLGTAVPGVMTAEDAIRAAGLDWPVVSHPAFYAPDADATEFKRAHGYKALVRGDNGAVLHVARETYRPLQNSEAFDFADSIIGTGAAKYETAGALDGGRRVWLLAELTRAPLIVAGSDEVRPYFLLHNSHDGTSKVRGILTPVRVVCHNTLSAALHGAKAGEGFALRHTAGIVNRADDARRALGLVLKSYDELGAQFSHLAAHSFTDASLADYVAEVFPLPTVGGDRALDNARARQRAAVQLAHEGKGNDVSAIRGTWWAAYNGATELLDHAGAWKSGEGRMKDTVFGGRAAVKALALSVALSYADATV